MDELELKGIWSAYDKKLERSLKLNLRIFEELQTVKAKSKLSSLLSIKVAGVITGILWNLFLGVLIYGNHFRNMYFTVSVSIIMAFGIIAIATYIKHVVLISQIDYSESITNAQHRLAELQLSTIRVTGFLWLQLPFYTTFFWSNEWVTKGDSGFWLIAFPITLLFTALAIWLYRNISPKNIDKKWVNKLMMIGMEYKYAQSASELLGEIEEFKRDEA
jgi:hypothetical protein